MPHGFFTVEQWTTPPTGGSFQWLPILHLDSHQTLTKALAALEKRGEPGLFRVLQMQRCVWAEKEDGKLRLHGSHSSSPGNLAGIVEIYEREGGRRPVAKARQERARAKANRSDAHTLFRGLDSVEILMQREESGAGSEGIPSAGGAATPSPGHRPQAQQRPRGGFRRRLD